MIKVCQLCGDKFETNGKPLKRCPKVHTKKCIICGKEIVITSKKQPKACDNKECIRLARKSGTESAMIRKYGVKNPWMIPEIKQKIRDNAIRKYGNACPANNKNLKKQSNIQRTYQLFDKKLAQFLTDKSFALSEYESLKQKLNRIPSLSDLYDLFGSRTQQISRKCKEYGFELVPFMSNLEKEFAQLLKEHNIDYTFNFELGHFLYDFKVSNILIEINPTYTHNSDNEIYGCPPKQKDYHYKKSLYANQHNYRCIHIFDWTNIKDIIDVISNKEKIFARKCIIKNIDNQTHRTFLENNHLQGFCGASVKLGLFYNDELVQVMTFGKPRFNQSYDWELLRLCSMKGIQVVGGASKLLSYFRKNYNGIICSYQDVSIFSGEVYRQLGFSFVRHCGENYKWIHMKTGEIKTRYQTQMKNEVKAMKSLGFVRVFDCGNNLWELNDAK